LLSIICVWPIQQCSVSFVWIWQVIIKVFVSFTVMYLMLCIYVHQHVGPLLASVANTTVSGASLNIYCLLYWCASVTQMLCASWHIELYSLLLCRLIFCLIVRISPMQQCLLNCDREFRRYCTFHWSLSRHYCYWVVDYKILVLKLYYLRRFLCPFVYAFHLLSYMTYHKQTNPVLDDQWHVAWLLSGHYLWLLSF